MQPQRRQTAGSWRGSGARPSPRPVSSAAAAALARSRRGHTPHAARRHHECRCSSAPGPAAPGPGVASTREEVEAAWRQLTDAKQRLATAVAAEDFGAAAALRDESRALLEALPPVQQFLFSQLERLRAGGQAEQREAISALGAAGDEAVLPELAACLRDPALQDAAHAAMWAVFGRCRDPGVMELMAEAEPLLHAGSEPALNRALSIYDDVIRAAPSFAEGWNKRATCYYLLQRHEDAIADCEMVLRLNAYHFGAASGMGLCHWSLKQTGPALAAFEAALSIHPGLTVIRRHVETLRAEEAARGRAAGGGGGGDRAAQQQQQQQQQQQEGGDA